METNSPILARNYLQRYFRHQHGVTPCVQTFYRDTVPSNVYLQYLAPLHSLSDSPKLT